MPAFATGHVTVYCGDVLAVLRELPDESVDCCVTSPPYWGLRDYGTAGQIGLERTPPEYVAVMVEVFREVRRVLAPHGTLWLNLGDSYNAYNGGAGPGSNLSKIQTEARPRLPSGFGIRDGALKPKDMVGIPWRVAFALQADGWYLRSDIIWAKPNPMPESVTDRPTKSHEYVFLLAKSERYFYDAAAINEPLTSSPSDLRKMIEGRDRIGGKNKDSDDLLLNASAHTEVGRKRAVGNADAALVALKRSGNKARKLDVPTRPNDHMGTSVPWIETPGLGRNARTVWTIATVPYPDAHFATFPRELPERAIKAGCPEQVCATCGVARERITSERAYPKELANAKKAHGGVGNNLGGQQHQDWLAEHPRTTTGFTDCGHGTYGPGVVLDPFAGSGTTLAVARDLGRKSIGIELNPAYVKLIETRCAQTALDLGA